MQNIGKEKMKYKIKIVKTPDSHDSNDAYYYDQEDNKIGYAYQSKDDQRFHIVRCPKCDTENYSLQQFEGSCYKCGFDPNVEEKND